jgi:sugar phosphate isomerase/epimerase
VDGGAVMKLGLVSAILPDLSLEEVATFAAEHGFEQIEVMCWPVGRAERRYAGVTHIDAATLNPAESRRILEMLAEKGVGISALGYYPNPLAADRAERQTYIDHLRKVMDAAALLGLDLVNTFIGRDPSRPIEAQWDDYLAVWEPLVQHATERGLRIGIENCPMLFTLDEWPGGTNLATSPAVWRKMFELIPSPNLGLNYDPSHFIIQHMDEAAPIWDFADKLFHVHAKDQRIDRRRLNDVGVWGLGWYLPKLPGLGEVRWAELFSALNDVGYDGTVAIEVEDPAYEDSLDGRKRALMQSKGYLDQFQAWS